MGGVLWVVIFGGEWWMRWKFGDFYRVDCGHTLFVRLNSRHFLVAAGTHMQLIELFLQTMSNLSSTT